MYGQEIRRERRQDVDKQQEREEERRANRVKLAESLTRRSQLF
jgi:hypothetical protein